MNMKKTMAAIAAGAVAVSAMATSVSAIQDTTLTYNLAATFEQTKVNDGTVNIVGSVYAQATGSNISVGVDNLTKLAWDNDIGAFKTDGKYVVKNISVTAKEFDKNTNTTSGVAVAFQGQPDNKQEYYASETKDGYLNLPIGTQGNRLKSDVWYRFDVVVTVAYNNDDYGAINSSIGGSMWDTAHPANQFPGIKVGFGNYNITGTEAAQSAGLVKKSEEKVNVKLPFKTATSGNDNIIRYLQNGITINGTTAKTKDKDTNYINVGAVINDAIANYEGVVFKFNTAADGIVWYVDGDFTKPYGKPGQDDWFTDGNRNYETALKDANGDASRLTAGYWSDWQADTSYKSFTDHLYNGQNNIANLIGNYAGEGTGYTGFDWSGYNLFQGALIINESLTMSLSDTEFFDWTATSISFDWDAIYSNAMTSNNYATYVQSLKLATSTTWYWDSMEVILTAGAAEDASSGAGAAGDEGTLDDDDNDDGDIALDDDDDDGDVVVDTNDDDDDDGADADTNDTQAPAQTASNPQTGNASVALAVIPVALAAAAIVAKKRG